ncbi:uncharacterized protein K02A2.6-like [Photinus pyralis]|uniref:uncharacterized protein K02A2.6-like n=1 Tax=Photinus pyralis TaxID=7054 RepID=UPI0012674D71|nr:uncharacterized protein K02A2.6-like [Photinus pyralis]
MPDKAPLHPWEWTRAPWTRLHLDFAGPMDGNFFLIVIDSHSKWLEVRQVATTSSAAAIRVLRELFATHGIPEVCVSDNGTAFTSTEYQDFLKQNGIRQALVAPYHPSSNGQAERMVQNTKNALKKMSGKDVQLKLNRYLLVQHITPHSVTGKSPSEILMGRKLNTLLDKVFPDFSRDMTTKQEAQSSHKIPRSFQEYDPVFSRSFVPGPKWIPTTVVKPTGPLSYKVATPDGKVIRRHTDQIRKRVEVSFPDRSEYPHEDSNDTFGGDENNDPPDASIDIPDSRDTLDHPDVPTTSGRPARTIRAPSYLKDYVT